MRCNTHPCIYFLFSFSQVPITQILKDLRKRRSLVLYLWVVLACVRGKKEEIEENESEEEEEGAAAVWVDWGQALALAAPPRMHLLCQIVRRGPDLHLRRPLIFTMIWPKRISHTWSLHWILFFLHCFRAGCVFAYVYHVQLNVGVYVDMWLI